MIKTLLFDGGGVIFIGKNMLKLSESLEKEYGVDSDVLWEHMFAHWEEFSTGKISAEEVYKTVSQELNIDIDPERVHELYFNKLEMIPGTLEFVKRLRKSHTLVLVNNEAKEWDIIKDKFSGYFSDFDHCCSSWIMGNKKPNKTYFLSVLEKLSLKPEECVFVDDKQSNIDVAESLGITSVRFENAKQLERDLATLGVRV